MCKVSGLWLSRRERVGSASLGFGVAVESNSIGSSRSFLALLVKLKRLPRRYAHFRGGVSVDRGREAWLSLVVIEASPLDLKLSVGTVLSTIDLSHGSDSPRTSLLTKKE